MHNILMLVLAVLHCIECMRSRDPHGTLAVVCQVSDNGHYSMLVGKEVITNNIISITKFANNFSTHADTLTVNLFMSVIKRGGTQFYDSSISSTFVVSKNRTMPSAQTKPLLP